MQKWKYVIIGFLVILGLAFILSKIPSREIELITQIQPSEAQASGTIEKKQKTALLAKYAHLDTWQKIDRLIDCESQGRNVKIIDSNGYYSYGILQYQSSTWSWWSRESGITGDPMIRADAIKMAKWAIENGYISHWTCAKLQGLL